MSDRWRYQVRIDLADELPEVARPDPHSPALAPLPEILERHHATMKCQFDAFADYVAEAEMQGAADFPLYRWTKATIENPAKKAKVPQVLYALRRGQRGLREGQGGRPRVRPAAPGRRQAAHAAGEARYQPRQQPAAAGAVPRIDGTANPVPGAGAAFRCHREHIRPGDAPAGSVLRRIGARP